MAHKTLTEANDYLIGFISNIDEMSVPLLEEAQRHIDRRLNRSSEVDELNSKLNAIAIERDELKAHVKELLQEIQALKSRTTRRRKAYLDCKRLLPCQKITLDKPTLNK